MGRNGADIPIGIISITHTGGQLQQLTSHRAAMRQLTLWLVVIHTKHTEVAESLKTHWSVMGLNPVKCDTLRGRERWRVMET